MGKCVSVEVCVQRGPCVHVCVGVSVGGGGVRCAGCSVAAN